MHEEKRSEDLLTANLSAAGGAVQIISRERERLRADLTRCAVAREHLEFGAEDLWI